MSSAMDGHSLVTLLKAAAEPTRLRILVLLAKGQFTVKDLTRILGQSQPRISRHLKLLAEAGLIERVREGSWAYFHLADAGPAGLLGRKLLEALDPEDRSVLRDAARAEQLKNERFEAAQAFFQSHAAEWDHIRSFHVDDVEVERTICEALGDEPIKLLVDLGTGTGRMLEVLSDRYVNAIGIDMNHAMLSYARSNLDRANLVNAQVRQGDICHLALDDSVADVVLMHQVLHFQSAPKQAIEEAARILIPGGRLVVVDFAPHDVEFLRDELAHQSLGFEREQVSQWMREADLDVVLTTDLVPAQEATDQKLTVSIWLAKRTEQDRPAITDVSSSRAIAKEGV